MEHDVFISYSSKEYDTANMIRTVLKNNGINCWMAPESIPGGANYMEAIPNAIVKSKAMILVLSKLSQESKWVPKEIALALNNNIVVIPFLIENCKINDVFNFILENAQRINAFEEMQKSLEELVRRLKGILSEVGKEINNSKDINIDINIVPNDTRATNGNFVTDDGDYYEGSLLNNKPHGKGKMEYANGDIYEGFWKSGKKNGRGVMQYVNGDKYEGTWQEDFKITGTCSKANGDIYIGNYKEDLQHGKGRYTWKNGDYYAGEWLEGKITGKGRAQFGDYKYEGEFVDAKYDGEGKLTFNQYYEYQRKDGTKGGGYNTDYYTYTGGFKNNKFDGYGEIIYTHYGREKLQNANDYKGEWKNGKREGNGKEENYTGEFKNDKRNGYGEERLTRINSDIEYYKIGEWNDNCLVTGKIKTDMFYGMDYIIECEIKENKLEGEYKRYENSKSVIESVMTGCYKEDIAIYNINQNGEVVIEWSNGEKYVGEIKEGLPHGSGSLTIKEPFTENKKEIIGKFEKGHPDGKVEVKYDNGDLYKGTLIFTLVRNKGRIEYSNGGYYEGEWYYDDSQTGKGYGKTIYNNGYYEGEYNGEKQQGKGKYVWNDGDIYEGDWKDGVKEGQGKYVWPNGEWYEGGWKNNKKHGKGKYKYTSGRIEQGEWYEGKKL